jgi:hypothetical protein
LAENITRHLGDVAIEQIAEDQYRVDAQFWPELKAMKVSKFGLMAHLGLEDGVGPAPPRPKLPTKLFRILGEYAIDLFDCEYRQYPQNELRLEWAKMLAVRIAKLCMDKVHHLESGIMAGLEHHASYAEMFRAIEKSLQGHIQMLTQRSGRVATLSTPTVTESTALMLGERPIGERLDDAAIDIGHLEQAHRIGISRSSYFEVKAGKGGKKAKRKAELYLASIVVKIDKSGLNQSDNPSSPD